MNKPITKKEPHKHQFNEDLEQKVYLRNGNQTISGYDILRSSKCRCGSTETHDIKERVKL